MMQMVMLYDESECQASNGVCLFNGKGKLLHGKRGLFTGLGQGSLKRVG